MSLNVINNFLDNDEFWKISKTVMANNFPWFLEDDSFSHHLIKPLDDGKYENSFFISLVLNKITEKIQISGGNEIDTIENRFVTFPINTAYFHSSHTDEQLKIFLKIVYTLD